MSIVIGPDGSLVNTSNVGSQFIPNITPNIGALANVASLGGSTIPKAVENEDGTITIPDIEMRVRGTGLEPGQLQNMYGVSGDRGIPMFEFLSPVQTGTTTFDPEDDNLMSDKNLDDIGVTTQGTGVPGNDVAQKQDLARIAQKGVGVIGQNIGMSMGNAFTGMNAPGSSGFTGNDVVASGFNSIIPFGSPTAAEKAGITYMDNIDPMMAGATGGVNAPTGYGELFQSRSFGERVIPGLKTAGFVAGGNFVGQVIAGADPMDAAKDAAKTGVAYFIGNAIAGPTGGKVAAWLSNLI